MAKAKEALKEGMDIMVKRQKLIKLADKSEYSWAMIKEYLDDELADNESDAKKIKKAERRATDRAKASLEKKRKHAKPNQKSSSVRFLASYGHSPSSTAYSSVPYFRPLQGRQFSRSQAIRYKCAIGHWVQICSRISSPAAGSSVK